MPFYIDGIHITKDETNVDFELKKLMQRSKGDSYEIYSINTLADALDTLAKKRDDTAYSFMREEVNTEIPLEHQPFYQNLADEPILLDEEVTCSVCFQKNKKDIVMCPSCETIVHSSCWSQWAKTSNIGMINVFRCHTCYNLLTLDKSYVGMVQSGVVPSLEDLQIEVLDLQEYLEGLEVEDGPKIVKADDDPLSVTIDFESLI